MTYEEAFDNIRKCAKHHGKHGVRNINSVYATDDESCFELTTETLKKAVQFFNEHRD